jgi:cytochrome c oxidase subunit 3
MQSRGSDGTTGVLDLSRRGPAGPPPPRDGGDGWGGGDGPDPRPPEDPRAGNAEFGLRLVLVAISALFLVFLALQWQTRTRAGAWPPPGAPPPPGILWLSTLLLALSSTTLARASLHAQRRARPRAWLAWTLVLGIAFLASQVLVGLALASAGVVPSSGPYGASFFALIGLHTAHVLVGLGYLGHLTAARRPRADQVQLAGIYWHFMGLLWLAVFALLWWPA